MLARLGYAVAVLAGSASAAVVGFMTTGSHPVSPNTLAFWLIGPRGTPYLMVYYHGPTLWYDAQWKLHSECTECTAGSVGWAELKSDKATLHLRLDLPAARAEIQHKAFSLAQNNTFLVVHTTDAQQRVIALGYHTLPWTGQMLLDSDKGLKKLIEKEVKEAH